MSLFLFFFFSFFFFFNNTATTEIYTLSLHDALPICSRPTVAASCFPSRPGTRRTRSPRDGTSRSEEHTSELQSPYDLVCRLLLEKKKNQQTKPIDTKNRYCMNT